MKQFLLSIVFLISFQISAQVNATASKVDFKIKNAGIMVDGKFDSIQAQLELKKNDWTQASLSGQVFSKSIKTGIGLRDQHLINDDYFNAEEYPWITLKSISFKKQKNEELVGHFELTIKDVKKEIEIPITYKREGNKVTIQGEFVINRQDFGLGEDSFVLSDDVSISFESVFIN